MNSDEYNALQIRQQGSLAQNRPSKYRSPISIEDAVSRKQDAISIIRKDKDKLKGLITWVKGRLIEVFTYLGAFDKVTEYQVFMLAQRICNKFFYLTPTELDFFFISFVNGEYRKLYNYNSVNPQDIMMSLIDFEKDLLIARGEAEKKRLAEELARQKAEDAKRPHGLEAWNLYCKKCGLDPASHKLEAVKFHDVNEELYPKRDDKGVVINKDCNEE